MALQSQKPDGLGFSPALLLPTCVVGLILAYYVGYCFYQLFCSPLRKITGPKLWSISNIPYVRLFLSGDGHRKILELHRKYGPVVRTGPRIISINHPDGFQELRGHRKGGAGENPKDRISALPNRDNILGSDRADHQRFRRALAHGFSAQSMLAQQLIIKQYVDTLFKKLQEESANGTRPVDVEKWFNFTMFDAIGDLAFSEPFGCLEGRTYHPWVDLIFRSIKNMAYITSIRRLSWLTPFLMLALPRDLANKFAQHKELSREKVRKRLDLRRDRPDFIEAMIRKSESAGSTISFEELTSNASVLIVAGSETTATLMSAATYFLATHPDILAKVSNEVRSKFKTEDQIDMLSVQNLPYLLAVLDESMRLFPPVPSANPRMIGEGGDTILGEFVPEGTTVDIWQWAVYHNPAHFAQPEDFIPERWLGDPRFANDAKQAFQPFSTGPRNCIGKNLAYAEVRLVMARLVWNYDIRPAADLSNWSEKSKVFVFWQKGAVNVYLTPRA